MKTSSCKAKGRRLMQEVRERILEVFPELGPDDVQVTPSSVAGEDLWLSEFAREILPFTWEGKNQESIQIWKALEQARGHALKRGNSIPLLVFRRNRSIPYVALSLTEFLIILTRRFPNDQNQSSH